MWCAPLPTPGPAPDTAPAQKKLKHLRVDATSMQVSLPVAMTWWAQRSALPRTRRVGRCRGGCAGGRCCTCRSGIDPHRPAGRADRSRQVASRRPRQPHGHPGPSTDHPATARPPRMPSRNACACCWPNTSRTRSGAGCTTSTTPPPAPTWRKPAAWRPRSTPGGQRCSSRSPRT